MVTMLRKQKYAKRVTNNGREIFADISHEGALDNLGLRRAVFLF
jgi:hypothetical protein